MTRSIIHPLVIDADIAGASAPGTISLNPDPLSSDTAIYPQRVSDEQGAWQIELNQDPGGSAKGFLVLQGRLHPGASFVTVSTIDISDFIGLSGDDLSTLISGVPILPQMRIQGVNDSTWLTAASTTVSAWVQE